MASIRTQFSVGLFVIVGLAILIIAVIWLGMSHYLDRGQYFAAYFAESVQGLDKDSPVKYRGVPVGRLVSLSVAPDGELIQAVLNIEKDIQPDADWVAQLRVVGFTGVMFIELDQRAFDEPDWSPKITFPSKYPIIPTRPSGMKQIMDGITDVVEQLRGIDLVGITTRLKQTIDRASVAIDEAQIGRLSTDLRETLASARTLLTHPRIEHILANVESAGAAFRDVGRHADATLDQVDVAVENLDRNISEVKDELSPAIADLRSTLQEAESMFAASTELVRDSRPRVGNLERQLVMTLRDLRTTLGNLDRLLNVLADQPSLLIFSEPRPPRKIGTVDESDRP